VGQVTGLQPNTEYSCYVVAINSLTGAAGVCSTELVITTRCACSAPGAIASTDFSGFTINGNIDQQQGWTTRDAFTTSTTTGSWNQAIKDDSENTRVWQVSNYVASATFSSQPFSPTSPQAAGENGAALWNNRGTNGASPISPPLFGANAETNCFCAEVTFRSATGAAQPGLQVNLSPSAKQSTVRMSLVQIVDNGVDGYRLDVSPGVYLDSGGSPQFPALIQYNPATTGLDYADWHTVTIAVQFFDGLAPEVNDETYGNDIVEVFVDGDLIHTGTTWEAYYNKAELIQAGTPRLQAVNALLFRLSNTVADPADRAALQGNGLYFRDVGVVNEASVSVPKPVPN
jgi:hypothetical protein